MFIILLEVEGWYKKETSEICVYWTEALGIYATNTPIKKKGSFLVYLWELGALFYCAGFSGVLLVFWAGKLTIIACGRRDGNTKNCCNKIYWIRSNCVCR